jgi:hypothetical protein
MASWLDEHSVQLLGPLVSVLGILVAARMVILQLSRQHENSLRVQRESARQTLKLQIYENFVRRIDGLSDALRESSMYVFAIPSAIESRHELIADGIPASGLDQRFRTFSKLHADAMDAAADVLIQIETWSIAFPGIDIFQIALNAAMFDAREAATQLYPALMQILPMEPPPGSPPEYATIVHSLPTGAALTEFRRLVQNYYDALSEIESYVSDLKVEGQNNLLASLFDHRVPRREPLDLARKVISTEPSIAAELKRYFWEDTAWGKHHTATEAEFRREFGNPANQRNVDSAPAEL